MALELIWQLLCQVPAAALSFVQPRELLVPGFAPAAVGTDPADSWIPGPGVAVRACSPWSSSAKGCFHSSFWHSMGEFAAGACLEPCGSGSGA